MTDLMQRACELLKLPHGVKFKPEAEVFLTILAEENLKLREMLRTTEDRLGKLEELYLKLAYERGVEPPEEKFVAPVDRPEEWRPLKDHFMGYEVSNYGRARSWRMPSNQGGWARRNHPVMLGSSGGKVRLTSSSTAKEKKCSQHEIYKMWEMAG